MTSLIYPAIVRAETADQTTPAAMEEGGASLSATGSLSSAMELADTPPTAVPGKRWRKRRMQRLVRWNGGEPTDLRSPCTG